MSIKKTNFLIALVIFANIIIISLWLLQNHTRLLNNGLQDYSLGTLTQYGYIGIELSYDKEPVDITLLSPSGQKLTKEYFDVYEVDELNHRMTALIDSNNLGQWQVALNKKSNTTVKYSFITGESPTLYLTNVKLTEINGLPYVTFLPIMSKDGNDECKYAITMSGKSKFFALDNGTVTLNEQAYILIEPDKNSYTENKYTIRVAVQSMDMQQSTHYDVTVILQPDDTLITE